MGAAQPANADITVQQRVRVVRDNRRHTSVKHLTTPFDDNYVAVPGREVQVEEIRDANFRTDAFRYGHAVVVKPRAACSVPTVYTLSGMDFPVRLPGNPREIQLQKSLANRTDDLFGEVRDVCS